MKMDEEDTIVDLKQQFLAGQIRLLSAPLRPTRDWSDDVRLAENQAELNHSVVEEALYQANTIARHHNQAVYSSQAARHVAEQIDALYWNSGATNQPWGRAGDEDVLNKDVDLTEERDLDRNRRGHGAGSREILTKQLNELAANLKEQKTKTAQFEHLQKLLRPLGSPKENVQPNIVTKDGELAKELDRMRVLIARVSGKIETLVDKKPRNDHDMDITDLDAAGKAKVDTLLKSSGSGN